MQECVAYMDRWIHERADEAIQTNLDILQLFQIYKKAWQSFQERTQKQCIKKQQSVTEIEKGDVVRSEEGDKWRTR
jgi:hypothetical protein